MALYWLLFAAYSLGHLAACFFEHERLRWLTKVFIVPLLLLGPVLTQTYNPLLFLGLTLGWIGDILLLFGDKKRLFVIGAFSFVAGHLSYIAATLLLFFEHNSLSRIPPYMYVILLLVGVILFTIAGCKVAKHIGSIAYLGAGYFTILFAALLFSLLEQRYLLTAAFAVFILSDTILSITRFGKKVRRRHFYVMLPYILAQTLICLSFMG